MIYSIWLVANSNQRILCLHFLVLYTVCRDGRATAAAGTITPTGDGGGGCNFVIEAPPDQRIEFTCTAINLTSFTSQLQVSSLLQLSFRAHAAYLEVHLHCVV
jgi:hypothetical protein